MSFLGSNLSYPSEKCLITNLKDFQYEYEPERNDPKSNHQTITNFSIFLHSDSSKFKRKLCETL